MMRINARETAKELEELRRGNSELWQESTSGALMDAVWLLKKYIAIEDIVMRPEGMHVPDGITVMDILNPNADVQMDSDGWSLMTWEERIFEREKEAEG